MMVLPPPVLQCLETLENGGFCAYCVGGCVRDALLGLEPQDYDICTSASPEEICRVFAQYPQVHNGEKHGTVGVILEHTMYEITTFRTEGGYRDNRHPDWVAFVTDIRQDLARRDFTVNAMAYSPSQGLCDPFGGQDDLNRKILRAVGDPRQRFSEDALRILRGARFAVRYGLQVEEATRDAMFSMAHRMDALARERVFSELCKLITLATTEDFLRFAPLLTQVIPELAPCVGFVQKNPHHIYDVYTHIAHVAGKVEQRLSLRWAALLHDVGKPDTFTLDEQGVGHFYGHGQRSAELADEILRRLKAPTALREQVVFLVGNHMELLLPDKKMLRRRLSRFGEENVRLLLLLQRADWMGTGTEFTAGHHGEIFALLDEISAENTCLHLKDLAVNGHDLSDLGLQGRQIGQTLEFLLENVLSEELPNEKNALLAAVRRRQVEEGEPL